MNSINGKRVNFNDILMYLFLLGGQKLIVYWTLQLKHTCTMYLFNAEQ